MCVHLFTHAHTHAHAGSKQKSPTLHSGTPPPVMRDGACRCSITNGDWCPFARLLTFIYLSVYLCRLYLLMDLRMRWRICVHIGRSGVQHFHVNEQETSRVQPFYLDSSSWNSYFSLVMEKRYGPFSYLAVIPTVELRLSLSLSLFTLLSLSPFVLLALIWLVHDGRIWVGSDCSFAREFSLALAALGATLSARCSAVVVDQIPWRVFNASST